MYTISPPGDHCLGGTGLWPVEGRDCDETTGETPVPLKSWRPAENATVYYSKGPPMLPQIAQEELAAALDATVAEVLAAGQVARPPVDALALARRFDFTVAWDHRQAGRARLVRLADRSAGGGLSILLRPDPRPERRQWAVAHEIGEYFSLRVFDSLGIDPREAPPAAREKVANLLANRLLLPTDWFAADGPDCGWDLLDLKRRYRTASHELIARRMLDFAQPIIISIFDQERLEFRRGNGPGRVPRPAAIERDCWRQVHESGRASGRLESGPLVVRGWPIHEPHWRREILRAELPEDFCEL
jgi:hypothetical protein